MKMFITLWIKSGYLDARVIPPNNHFDPCDVEKAIPEENIEYKLRSILKIIASPSFELYPVVYDDHINAIRCQ